jgi:hypothetical protein
MLERGRERERERERERARARERERGERAFENVYPIAERGELPWFDQSTFFSGSNVSKNLTRKSDNLLSGTPDEASAYRKSTYNEYDSVTDTSNTAKWYKQNSNERSLLRQKLGKQGKQSRTSINSGKIISESMLVRFVSIREGCPATHIL